MRHYDLPIIRGASVSPINSERGVELGRAADGREALAFAERDGTREVPLAEIESVRLMLGGSFFRPIPQLRMQFKAGDKLTVSGGSGAGLPSAEARETYARFVHDLHEALARAGAEPALKAGWPQGGYYLVAGAAILFGLSAVGVPLVAALTGHAAEALPIFGVGALVAYFWLRQVFRNAPRDYAADEVPDELLG